MIFTVTVPFKFDEEFINDVLTGAFEGGSNYWIGSVQIVDDVPNTAYMSTTVAQGGSVKIRTDDEDDDVWYTLARPDFLRGFQKYVEYRSKHGLIFYTDAGDIDAEHADMILQFAIFGDVVYG